MSSQSRHRARGVDDLADADALAGEMLAADADGVERVTARHWREAVLDGRTVKQVLGNTPAQTHVNLVLDPRMAAAVNGLASQDGMNRTAWIRLVLARYIAERTETDPVSALGSMATATSPRRRAPR